MVNANTTISTKQAVNLSNITVNPPAIFNVTSGQGVRILPITIIKAGSTAKIKIDPTLK